MFLALVSCPLKFAASLLYHKLWKFKWLQQMPLLKASRRYFLFNKLLAPYPFPAGGFLGADDGFARFRLGCRSSRWYTECCLHTGALIGVCTKIGKTMNNLQEQFWLLCSIWLAKKFFITYCIDMNFRNIRLHLIQKNKLQIL